MAGFFFYLFRKIQAFVPFLSDIDLSPKTSPQIVYFENIIFLKACALHFQFENLHHTYLG